MGGQSVKQTKHLMRGRPLYTVAYRDSDNSPAGYFQDKKRFFEFELEGTLWTLALTFTDRHLPRPSRLARRP